MTSRTSLRCTLLAAATALAFSASLAATEFSASDRSNPRAHVHQIQPGETYDRFIIKFHDDVAAMRGTAGRQSVYALANRSAGVTSSEQFELSVGGHVVGVSRALGGKAAAAYMNAIAKDPAVEYIEPDRMLRHSYTPNDTSYSSQWHYFEATGGIGLPAAWDVADGSGTVVAVLDTGSTSHSDLNANTVSGYDFISSSSTARDGNGRDSNPQDQGDWVSASECYSGSPASGSSWHGTHVAGTVAAVTNNGSGVAGVSRNGKVQHVRVLGRCGGSTADIADAITWASGGSVSGIPANPTPAEVINLSLGGGGSCGATTQNAINGAVSRGTVLVIAAGNSNTNVANATPANCNNVIAVAATTQSGARASFSNYGTGIDVSAPGQGILSTLNSGSTTPGSASYASYSGTSMSAPHVAGVVALMQSVATSTPAQVESILKSTARPLPGACSGGCGAGIIDAPDAIAALGGGGGPDPDPDPEPGDTVLTNGVAKTGLSASSGSMLMYTLVVPSGASNLSFAISGGTGDADLYVRRGSAPTTATYDCRPYLSGNNETCNIPSPVAGTYYVGVRAYSTFSGVNLIGSYTAGGGGGGASFFENTGNYTINDLQTVESPIAVSRSGNAPSDLEVDVRIIHTYKGDLIVNLVAPDGSTYLLHNGSGGGTDNVIGTYTVNASSESASGTWRLRVYDRYNGDTGYIDSWSLQF